MTLYASGQATGLELGFENTIYNKYGDDCIDCFQRIPFDLEGIQCISGGIGHSVIIKSWNVFATGYKCFIKGSSNINESLVFKKFQICDEPISWAACGCEFTLYLTLNGKVVICYKKNRDTRGETRLIPKKAVSVFAGVDFGGIIDEEGGFYIINIDNSHKTPLRFYLGAPAVEIACNTYFICVLTADGRVFGNISFNNGSHDFVEVESLKGKKIKKISGFINTCAALTHDGHVFTYGANNWGELGNGTKTENFSEFTEVHFKEEIKDVSCACHTLFLTRSNKIYGCGFNRYFQLFKKTKEENVLSPIFIATMEADQVISCANSSFVLSGTGYISNPAIKLWMKEMNEFEKPKITKKITKTEENCTKKRESIDDLTVKCKCQSQTISQLIEICRALEHQSETFKNEIMSVCNENMRMMSEMHEELQIQKIMIQEMKVKNMNFMESNIINDQDFI